MGVEAVAILVGWVDSLHPSHSYGHAGTVSSPNHTNFFHWQA